MPAGVTPGLTPYWPACSAGRRGNTWADSRLARLQCRPGNTWADSRLAHLQCRLAASGPGSDGISPEPTTAAPACPPVSRQLSGPPALDGRDQTHHPWLPAATAAAAAAAAARVQATGPDLAPAPRRRRRQLHRLLDQTQLLRHDVAHDELLDLAGDRLREVVSELDVARYLVVGDLRDRQRVSVRDVAKVSYRDQYQRGSRRYEWILVPLGRERRKRERRSSAIRRKHCLKNSEPAASGMSAGVMKCAQTADHSPPLLLLAYRRHQCRGGRGGGG